MIYTYLIKELGLERCIGCGNCTSVCPSARNGGIVPHEAVQAVLDGVDVKDIWKCLICHRCSAVCPVEINVTQMMTSLRNVSENVPDRFKKTGQQMFKGGKIFIPIGRMESVRKELGLSVEVIEERTLNESKIILKRAGFNE